MNAQQVLDHNSPEVMAKTIIALKQDLKTKTDDMSQAWAILTMASTQLNLDQLVDRKVANDIERARRRLYKHVSVAT